MPRSHGYEVTALYIIYTQPVTYVIFKVVKRVGKFSINAVSKKIFEMLLVRLIHCQQLQKWIKMKKK